MKNPKNTKLRFYRVRAGLTQREVGDELEIASYVLSDYETGRAEPSIATLKKLSVLYNASIDELLGNDYSPTPPDDPKLQELLKVINSYEGKARENAIEMAIEILKKTKK